MTFVFTAKDVQKVLDMKTALQTVEQAFKAFGNGKATLPPKSYITFKDGDLRSMPAYINDGKMNIAGIKSVNVHPNNPRKHNLPTVMAMILLTDPVNGFPSAVLDGTYITNMRTGAAGGVATKYLSRKDSKVLTLFGAGTQAHTQLDAISKVRKIKEVRVVSRRIESATRFCLDASKHHKRITFLPGVDGKKACKGADIITTVTPSRKPVVKKSWVDPGTHINGIGADAAGKQELETSLTCSAKVIIDEWQQASHSGEINVPISKKKFHKRNVHAELGQIVAGKKKGRTNNKEITVFDSTGLAIQDISCAYIAYKKLLKSKKKLRHVKMF